VRGEIQITTGGARGGMQRRGRILVEGAREKIIHFLADPNLYYLLLGNDTSMTNHCYNSREFLFQPSLQKKM
jgi:hypothetical protein